MNIQFNNMSFQGQKDVIYGLKNVAELTKQYEMTNISYAHGRAPVQNRINNLSIYEASMKAYADMIAYDDEFVKTITDISTDDLKCLKRILVPTFTEHGLIQPLAKFVYIMDRAVAKHNKVNGRNTFHEFITKLK